MWTADPSAGEQAGTAYNWLKWGFEALRVGVIKEASIKKQLHEHGQWYRSG